MRIVFDTKEISSKAKEMAVSAKENIQKTGETVGDKFTNKSADRKISSLLDMQADVEYMALVVDWNTKRLNNNQTLYIPDGMDKNSQRILKKSVLKNLGREDA